MAMLTLNGQVLNVFQTNPYTDKKTGEITPSRYRVQIMAENQLQNGAVRMDLVNLTVDDPAPYQKLAGRVVRVPVGAFVNQGSIQFYALRGLEPKAEAVSDSARGAALTAAA